jgi:hypothetical protein
MHYLERLFSRKLRNYDNSSEIVLATQSPIEKVRQNFESQRFIELSDDNQKAYFELDQMARNGTLAKYPRLNELYQIAAETTGQELYQGEFVDVEIENNSFSIIDSTLHQIKTLKEPILISRIQGSKVIISGENLVECALDDIINSTLNITSGLKRITIKKCFESSITTNSAEDYLNIINAERSKVIFYPSSTNKSNFIGNIKSSVIELKTNSTSISINSAENCLIITNGSNPVIKNTKGCTIMCKLTSEEIKKWENKFKLSFD